MYAHLPPNRLEHLEIGLDEAHEPLTSHLESHQSNDGISQRDQTQCLSLFCNEPLTSYLESHQSNDGISQRDQTQCLSLFLVLPLAWISDRFQGQNVWQNWPESHELRKPSYTEAVHSADLFRTQANTWSNLAYVLVGFYCIALGMHDRAHASTSECNYIVDTPAMSILMGVACCYLGIGSGLFHASLTRWGQQLDVGAMYAPLLVCIAINWGRYLPRAWRLSADVSLPVWSVLLASVVLIAALLYHYKWSMSSSQVLPLHILTVIAFAIADSIPLPRGLHRSRLHKRWLLIAFVSLTLAITFRQLDVAGRFGTPDTFLQGHALWHLLTAASLGAMYLYYRSESVLSRSRWLDDNKVINERAVK